MEGRAMTPGEIKLGESIFGSLINYTEVQVFNGKWKWFIPKEHPHAPDGNIYFPGDSSEDILSEYYEDFSVAPPPNRGYFIHELTHVWQHQRKLALPVYIFIAMSPSREYGEIFNGTDYYSLGLEGQAEFVEDYFHMKSGYANPNKKIPQGKSDYERVMPMALRATAIG
jgi:hypothetical protein